MEKILSNGNYQYGSGKFFENLPLLIIKDRQTQSTIKKLVKIVSDNITQNVINEIDRIVFELYGLTNEEIEFIEKSCTLSNK